VGRGSSIEAFPLFGLSLEDYDSLFAEKLDLLLKIRDNEHVHWSGEYQPSLNGQGVYPRPLQNPLPIWIGVGGTHTIIRPCRDAWTPVDGRNHRRRNPQLPATHRSLQGGWEASRLFTTTIESRGTFAGLCRREHPRGSR
jgi:luciferase-like monooxygenase